MSSINLENSLCSKEILKKIEELYESFGLDLDDMGPEEISRICKYYTANKKELNRDIEKFSSSKYSNKKDLGKTEKGNAKQKKHN